MADFYRQLAVLRNDWMDCTDCSLGERRLTVNGEFVFGEGSRRGVMFIGKGPSRKDEKEGRPFTSDPGLVLRNAVNKLNIKPFYFTNIVTCRSCGQAYDNEGNPRFKRDWKTQIEYPDIRDQAPLPVQVAACTPRLHEEIYLVDPMLIVTLGKEATQALTKKSVSILEATGTMTSVTIPGRSHQATITEKKRLWVRKVRKEMVMPTIRNEVIYPLIPIIDPAYVIANISDQRHGAPIKKFVDGMRHVRDTYYRYIIETQGDFIPATDDFTEDDLMESVNNG